jgi:hypothetical protein
MARPLRLEYPGAVYHWPVATSGQPAVLLAMDQLPAAVLEDETMRDSGTGSISDLI